MDYDYQVITNRKVTNYIWDNQQNKMIEGKRERDIPWWRIHRIAEDLGGTVSHKTIIHSNGKHVKQITIEFEEEN
tara:strand:- start:2402 stop:2626 length:225 start_codon:yes stop_codon:yes gene_type:complete